MNSHGSDPPHAQGPFERRVDVPYRELDIEGLQSEIASQLAERRYPREGVFAIRLAIEEALVNAYRHGNRCDAGKRVSFACRIDDEAARFEVGDQGPGFDIDSVPDPTDDGNVEKTSGRGLMLMEFYMSEVKYNDTGNQIRMLKIRSELPSTN